MPAKFTECYLSVQLTKVSIFILTQKRKRLQRCIFYTIYYSLRGFSCHIVWQNSVFAIGDCLVQ